MSKTALIVGAGSGISASFARLLAKDGYRVALVARNPAKLTGLAAETKATTHSCDAADPTSVDQLFAQIDREFPKLDVCLFNASARAQGPITDVDREHARRALLILAYGGFLVAQAAARRMLPRGAGTILLTGASASVKGYPQSAVFAMGKFALRGLAQSMARELAPKGIHVAHIVVDGAIDGRFTRSNRPDAEALLAEDRILKPEEIAANFVWVHKQPRSAWTHELDLRPWAENW